MGRGKPGCDLGPTLSFKDVHHPRWGGGRVEPELYLPRGFVGRARRLSSWCPLLPEGGCRAVCTGGPPKISRAARAAFVFCGGSPFAPVRRLHAEVGASLAREDLSGDLSEG
jgi:hypothetical protein